MGFFFFFLQLDYCFHKKHISRNANWFHQISFHAHSQTLWNKSILRLTWVLVWWRNATHLVMMKLLEEHIYNPFSIFFGSVYYTASLTNFPSYILLWNSQFPSPQNEGSQRSRTASCVKTHRTKHWFTGICVFYRPLSNPERHLPRRQPLNPRVTGQCAPTTGHTRSLPLSLSH